MKIGGMMDRMSDTDGIPGYSHHVEDNEWLGQFFHGEVVIRYDFFSQQVLDSHSSLLSSFLVQVDKFFFAVRYKWMMISLHATSEQLFQLSEP